VDNQPDDDGLPSPPGETWDHYAQIQTDRQPSGKVGDKASYSRKTRKNALEDHALVAKARRWWNGFDGITPRRLAECLADDKPPSDLPFSLPQGMRESI
jgi:hypothetical protein